MTIDKLSHAYVTLDRAVEQFSQPLLPDQIAFFAYKTFIEVLDLHATALFLSADHRYYLADQQYYDTSVQEVPLTQQLRDLPVFHAGLIMHHYERWFPQKWIDDYEPTLIVPLVIKDSLYGWIVSKGNTESGLDDDRLSLAHTLLYLVQSALEKSEQQQTLVNMQKQFDKHRYTMMALQTYTASLLTQNSLAALYEQAVDAFSELTRSTQTALAVWDEFRQRLILVAFRDLLSRRKLYSEFFLCDDSASHHLGRLYDLTKDRSLLERIFVSLDYFEDLSAKYVILLGKEKVLGFVTLSDSGVLEEDDRFFETIQLLASITYLAILQARRWEEVILQRDLNERKVQTLSTLHHLTENLGLCNDLEELLALTTQTLTVHAKVTRMWIALRNQDQVLDIKFSIGMNENFFMSDEVMMQLFADSDATVYDYTAAGAYAWLDGLDIPQDEATNCLIAVPFWRSQILDFWHSSEQKTQDLFGCLCVIGVDGELTEEHYLMIDTIAHNMKPFLRFYDSES